MDVCKFISSKKRTKLDRSNIQSNRIFRMENLYMLTFKKKVLEFKRKKNKEKILQKTICFDK